MTTAQTDEERQLAALRERAIAELATIETTDGLDEWRTRYFGRESGELSAILRGLGKLPGEQARWPGGEHRQGRARAQGRRSAR
jgi:hypothetical protein